MVWVKVRMLPREKAQSVNAIKNESITNNFLGCQYQHPKNLGFTHFKLALVICTNLIQIKK